MKKQLRLPILLTILFIASLLQFFSCKKSDSNTSPTDRNTGIKTISMRFRANIYNDTANDGTPVKYDLVYDGDRLMIAKPNADAFFLGTIYFLYSGNNVKSVFRTVVDRQHGGDTVMFDSLSFKYTGDRIDSMIVCQKYRNVSRETYRGGFTYSGNTLSGINSDLFDPISATASGTNIVSLSIVSSSYSCNYGLTNIHNSLASLPIWLIMSLTQSYTDYYWLYPLLINSDLIYTFYLPSGVGLPNK